MKTTTNNKQIGNNGFTYTLMTGALLALLTLPTLGMAGQQIQLASLENTFNSHVVFNDIAEDYGDINDEEETAVDAGDSKSDVMSKSITNLNLMVAANDATGDAAEDKAYSDNQDDG